METFEQIWESSRHNAYSWMYPTVMSCGMASLVALSVIRHRYVRRIGKLLVIAAFSLLATTAAEVEISEKWIIRRRWAEMHPERMTSDGSMALQADTNLTLGPLIVGAQTLVLFVAVAMLLRFFRWLANSQQSQNM